MSHQELTDKLGYKRAYGIVDLERGFNPIHYKDAVKIGEILEIDPEDLLNEYTQFCKPGYGTCIAKIREMYGMTQQEFSNLICVTRSRLSAWESECTGFSAGGDRLRAQHESKEGERAVRHQRHHPLCEREHC